MNKRNMIMALCGCTAILSICGYGQDAAPASGGKGSVQFPGGKPSPQELQAMSQAAAKFNKGGSPPGTGPATGADTQK